MPVLIVEPVFSASTLEITPTPLRTEVAFGLSPVNAQLCVLPDAGFITIVTSSVFSPGHFTWLVIGFTSGVGSTLIMTSLGTPLHVLLVVL